MTTYTNISKPSSTTYTSQNAQGKQVYDEATLTYDDVNVFYDSVNPNIYTNISKPSSTGYTNIAKPT